MWPSTGTLRTALVALVLGGAAAAQAQLAMGLAGAYGDEVASMDGDTIDAQLQQTCPDIRTEALKRAGLDSFGHM